jgi:hypothetical protein
VRSAAQLDREVAQSLAGRAPSKGHLAWIDDYSSEAYVQNNEVFVAPSSRPLDAHGHRQGARWESSRSHWSRYYDAVWRSRVVPEEREAAR